MNNNFEPGSIEYAKNIIGCDPFATFLGIKVEHAEENYCKCSLVLEPHHLNALERIHGSVVCSMCDQVMAVAANTQGRRALSLSMSINFIGSALCGERIISEAVPVNISNKIIVWHVEVKSNDKVIASGNVTAYHK